VIESRKIRMAVAHVARMVKIKIYIKFWSEILKRKDHLRDITLDEKIILKLIL
jgi:hypothetical protein